MKLLILVSLVFASCGNPFVRDLDSNQDLELTLVFGQSRSLGVSTDFAGKIVTVKLYRQSAPTESIQTSSGPVQFSASTQSPQFTVNFNNVPGSAELFLTAEIADTDSAKTVYFEGQSSVFRMTQVGTATLDLSVNPVTFPNTAKTITSFSFRSDLNSNLSQTYTPSIVGTDLELTLPNGTDRNLIPTFAHTGLRVLEGGNPVTSGVTEIDFTDPVIFTVEDRQTTPGTLEYTITVSLEAPPPPPVIPGSPTGLTIQQVNDSSLLLNWTAATGTVDEYRIYLDNVLIQTVGPAVLNYTINTFTPGTPLEIEIRASNTEGESTPTTPISVTPLGSFNVLTPTNSATSVILVPEITWETSLGATSYMVTVTGTPVVNQPVGGTSFSISAGILDRSTTYEITITATNADFALNSPPVIFTTRDSVLYVDGSVGVDSPENGATTAQPFQTIQYAVSQAINGDEIRIAQGTYQGGFTIGKSITLNGDWDPGFSTQDPSPGTTITTPATPATTLQINSAGIDVIIRNLRIELKNPSVATNFSALSIFDSNSVILDSVRAMVNDATNQPFSSAISIGNGATSVTIHGSVINLNEATATSDSAGIEIGGVFNGTLMIGGPTPEDGNVFQTAAGSSMNHHIRITGGIPTPAPNITIQNNSFESLTGTMNQWQHSLYVQSTSSNLTILDNTFAGHTNSGTNSVYAIRTSGTGDRDIRRNIFDLEGDPDSQIYGILLFLDPLVTNIGNIVLDSNKIRFFKDVADTNTHFGIVLDRSALVMNNIIVQQGTGTGGGTFRPITVNSENVDVFHNSFINYIGNAPFEGIYVTTGQMNQRFTNNIIFNASGNANGIVIATNPTIYGEINFNQFGGIIEENLLSGITTLLNLNLATNANGNLLYFPSFLTPMNMADPTWFEPDVLNDGINDHAATVQFDINGNPRGNPPQIGAYE